MKKIVTPLHSELVESLLAGEEVWLSGEVFTMRDRTHTLLYELVKRGEKAPFELQGAVIFYAGPIFSPDGQSIKAIGPTTSKRMDIFTPFFLRAGVKGMIGKGPRGAKVVEAIKENKAVYLVAPGGAAAFLSHFVKKFETIAFPDLGPEAVYRLEVEEFPLVVAVDSYGRSVFSRWEKNLSSGEEI